MATQLQIQQFIATIGPIAQKAYKTLGKVKPSVCIAMACVESAYGTAGSCKHHSYLGQKTGTGKTATKYWDKTFFVTKTKEEYTVGVHTTIRDAFRSYKDMEQCVFNYYELLNTSLYSRVKAEMGYTEQMLAIKACGYMTSSTEVNTVLNIIKRYDLTRFDCVGQKSKLSEMTVDNNPFKEPTRVITLGSKGEDALWVNWCLWRFGLISREQVLNEIDVNCYRAIKTAQEKLGLDADGKVGAITKETFKKVCKID